MNFHLLFLAPAGFPSGWQSLKDSLNYNFSASIISFNKIKVIGYPAPFHWRLQLILLDTIQARYLNNEKNQRFLEVDENTGHSYWKHQDSLSG